MPLLSIFIPDQIIVPSHVQANREITRMRKGEISVFSDAGTQFQNLRRCSMKVSTWLLTAQ